MTPARLAVLSEQMAAGYLDGDAMETVEELLARVAVLQVLETTWRKMLESHSARIIKYRDALNRIHHATTEPYIETMCDAALGDV